MPLDNSVPHNGNFGAKSHQWMAGAEVVWLSVLVESSGQQYVYLKWNNLIFLSSQSLKLIQTKTQHTVATLKRSLLLQGAATRITRTGHLET